MSSENPAIPFFSHPKISAYIALMRFDKPIGIYLLLWPTLWGLWFAAHGIPSAKNLVIFICGVILMRAAGCVINDYADRNFDAHVKRTEKRPLATGALTAKNALILFASLCSAAFCLVLLTNKLTTLLACFAFLFASIYPFMKRYTHFPQVILGIAFAFSIPMGFAAQTNTVPKLAWLLMLASILWTIAYDTQYAMIDRDDDLKIGIKSTAILFGKNDRLIITCLQIAMLAILTLIGIWQQLNWVYMGALFITAALFAYQYRLLKTNNKQAYLRAFLNNHWVGMVIFVGIAASIVV